MLRFNMRGQLFKAPVGKHTLFKSGWRTACFKLFGNNIFGNFQGKIRFNNISHRISHIKAVFALFKNIRRFADFPEVVIACKRSRIDTHREGFAFPGV